MINFNNKLFSSDDIDYWVTSDLHFFHGGILRFCPNTRPWPTIEEMHESLIEEWNTKVKPDDVVFHLGDFSFAGKSKTEDIISRLNGNIVWILGNHDNKVFSSIKCNKHHYLEVRMDGVKVCMMHYPLASFNRQAHGSVMLHGHCVDTSTEVLTSNGWLKYDEVSVGDEVISYNFEKEEMEIDLCLDYHLLENYEGKVFTNDTRKFSFRGTGNHRLVGLSLGGAVKEVLVEDYVKTQTKLKFVRSGVLPARGLDLTDDEIRLYICLAADGSVVNTDLGRLRVKKLYKIKYFKQLLQRLGIYYTENTHKDGSICLNFTVPDSIMCFNIKGLDPKIMECNKEQVECIIEAYQITDGYKNQGGTIIYTSKKEEKDLLQRLFTLNGFMCTVGVRKSGHGFSVKDNYEICVSDKTHQVTYPNNFVVEECTGETFWCITTKNSNFVCRRNGKVHVTGNCHGRYKQDGRAIDVGYDNLGSIIKLKDAVDLALQYDIVCPDKRIEGK